MIGDGASAADAVGGLARAAASSRGLPLDRTAPVLLHRDGVPAPPPGWSPSPWDLGTAYEQALDRVHRRRHGVHYTPRPIADGLVRIALGGAAHAEVCDPAAGSGAFLLAAADHLERLGVPPETVVAERLWGIDIDPTAIEVCHAALALWASRHGAWRGPGDHLVVADTLRAGRRAFGGRSRGFDAVVGNPPFQSQLQAATARSPEDGQQLRDRWCPTAGAYADTAAYFMVAALELCDHGGAVVLVQPQSSLATGDVEPIRRQLLGEASLEGLWIGDGEAFAAAVRVCAPLLRRGGTDRPTVARWLGSTMERLPPAGPADHRWSALVADVLGAPGVRPRPGGVLADSCTATAGFRDEFYALATHAVDDAEGPGPPLVTVGMIDPLRNRWGRGTFRIAGCRWSHPRVDVEALAEHQPGVHRWMSRLLRPKVLVATQTKTIEAVADEEGTLVPCTPVIAVLPDPDRIWHVTSALLSPVAAAGALAASAGAALSAGTIKLSARQVLALPVPADVSAWDEGAELAERASGCASPDEWRETLLELGQVMCRAHGVGADTDRLLDWWAPRLPPWR